MRRVNPWHLARAIVAALSLGAVVRSADAQAIALVGGTVYPVSGPKIERGTVVLRDGRVVAVGRDVAIPADARRIDVTGRVVTPGFVNAGTQLGVVEIGAVRDTRDASARGRDAIAAAFAVWEGFNPASELIQPARNEGVTTAIVVPNGGLVSGQAAVVHLDGRTASDALLRPSAAMVAQVGDARSAAVGARGELIGRLRELLVDARAYGRSRAAYERNQTRTYTASRADLEALQPVLAGRLPMLVAADRAADIDAALRLRREFGFRLMILGGAEAWELADRLAADRVPVVTGAMNNIPADFASLGQRQENAALLTNAGVPVALIGNAGGGDEESFNVRNVRFEAGNAVAYGMRYDAALRAVTLTPAELFGVADRVGSLAPGRDADVVVWSGDPFEFATRAEHVFIRGREVTGDSRQDELARRYRTLPPAYTTP
ncbi:amidohydrolase [Gemmatimonadetes bacterium T265]|nr:amidohydrolase [Gemmatimonadetes bacterium T265]